MAAAFLTGVATGAATLAATGVAIFPPLAATLLCAIIIALRATDLCLLFLFLSLDFGRVVLWVVTPCCLLACALVILR